MLNLTTEAANQRDLSALRVAIITKTNNGARWLEPFVLAMAGSAAEVQVFVPDEEGDLDLRLRACGVRVVRSKALGRPSIGGLLDFRKLRRELATFDVANYFLYRAALVSRLALLGTETVSIHSIAGPAIYESRVIRLIERLLARQDSVVFAGSLAVKQEAVSAGYPADRVRVVRFGADMDFFEPPSQQVRDAARLELGLDSMPVVFVMVAYWYGKKRMGLGGEDIKGHDILLEAWSRYRDQGGIGHLVLVGGGFGDRGAKYRDVMLRSTGVCFEDSVSLVETVHDVRKYYSAADVSVSPSRSENYGAVAEAAAMGVPSLVSDAGGLPEVVTNGETGWVVPAGDAAALAKGLHDAELAVTDGTAAEHGRAARHFVSNLLDWTLIVSDYLAEVREAVGSE